MCAPRMAFAWLRPQDAWQTGRAHGAHLQASAPPRVQRARPPAPPAAAEERMVEQLCRLPASSAQPYRLRWLAAAPSAHDILRTRMSA